MRKSRWDRGLLNGLNSMLQAAELKEREGDLVTAVHLFLKGGLPARAAGIINRCASRSRSRP